MDGKPTAVPEHQFNVNPRAPDDRHIYGDAADMFTLTTERPLAPFLPVLLKRSQSPISVVRSGGIRMLATVYENNKALTADNRRAIHQRVLAAANDSTDVGARIAGIQSLGAVGDSSDLALLQRISASRSVGIKKLKARLSAR